MESEILRNQSYFNLEAWNICSVCSKKCSFPRFLLNASYCLHYNKGSLVLFLWQDKSDFSSLHNYITFQSLISPELYPFSKFCCLVDCDSIVDCDSRGGMKPALFIIIYRVSTPIRWAFYPKQMQILTSAVGYHFHYDCTGEKETFQHVRYVLWREKCFMQQTLVTWKASMKKAFTRGFFKQEEL